ncbi:MAG: hypothetical protein GYA17_17775 [Chloroflexi bacterium]|nr:hypothetical protein [Anaerolineaceae bacterium]NMB90212.1 hypothetical protein [Chloroflexota bacterium]
MKRTNPPGKNRRSLRWIITAGSIAATLGFWGLLSQGQAAAAVDPNAAASGAAPGLAGEPAIPTLVPRLQANASSNSSVTSGLTRRFAPITITRSSR